MQQIYNDIPWRVGTYEVFSGASNNESNAYGRFYFFNNIGMSKDNKTASLTGLKYNFTSVYPNYRRNLLKLSNSSAGLNAEYVEVTEIYEDNPNDESDDKFMHVQVKHKPYRLENVTTWDFWAVDTGPETVILDVTMDAIGSGTEANTAITVKIGLAEAQSATLSFGLWASSSLQTVMCDIYQYSDYNFSSSYFYLTLTDKQNVATVYDLHYARTCTGFDPLMQVPIFTWGILQHDNTNAGQYTGTLKFNAASNWYMSPIGDRYLCGPEWIYFNAPR